MKKVFNFMKKLNGATVIASLAMILAVGVANSCCVFIYHQPEMPDQIKRLQRF